jgi:hypothetical protein
MARQSLGEKFISSAVRQIGRDLGKTVSNELFGDAHSTPVRHIKGDQTVDKSSLSPEERVTLHIAEKQAQEEKKKAIWGWIIAAAVVSIGSALLELL